MRFTQVIRALNVSHTRINRNPVTDFNFNNDLNKYMEFRRNKIHEHNQYMILIKQKNKIKNNGKNKRNTPLKRIRPSIDIEREYEKNKEEIKWEIKKAIEHTWKN